jgi:hypothetical protein
VKQAMSSRKRFLSIVLAAVICLAAVPSLLAQVTVTAANPSAAAPGTVNLNVTISGSGFKRGAKAQFFLSGTPNPGDVVVNSTTFTSSSQVVATVNVSSSAADASYDIQVQNANGSSGKGTELFGVNSTASGSCTSQNPAVNVILAPGSNGLHLLYGDKDFGTGSSTYNNPNDAEFNGGTIYTGGVFNVCSGSSDLTLNLNTTPRFINVSFFQQLTAADPGAIDVSNHTYSAQFFNVRELYTVQSVGGSLLTCLYTTTQGGALYFQNPATYISRGGFCADGAPAVVANSGGDTSFIQVTHPDSCTWIVRPVPDSLGHARGGLAQTIKKQVLSGGQYNLPFAMKVVLSTCPLN